MTREIALHCMKSYSELHSDLCEECPIYGQTGSDHCFEDALQYVIGMLEQEPCEDYISRQEAINKMQELEDEDIKAYGCEIPEGFDGKRAIEALKTLPPVTPKPKTDVLDKIRAEIGQYEANCRLQGGTDECEKCNSNVFGSIYRIIDKYKAEKEQE